ncbi:MAG: cation:proton antiporter [Candidatus Aenigmatarchaeota archaeon]
MIEVIYLLALVFVLSSIFLFIFHKAFKLTIPAYIIAGIIGGLFLGEEALLELVKWGIVFVVFIFGAKLEPDKLKHGIGGSLFSVAIQVAGLGIGSFAVLYFTGFSTLDAVFVSAAVVFSSSLTGTELVEKYATVELLYGRLAEATDVIHDVLAICLILLLSPILFNVNLGYTITVAGGMLAVCLAIRKFLFPWIFEICDSSEELMLLSGISILALMITISEMAGLSIVVGAFFAGLTFSRFPYNIELVENMESLKDFFAAVFFFSLGALLTMPGLPSLIIAAVIILITVFVKPLLTSLSLMQYGYDKRTAYRCGLTLDQISEFVLILIIQAHLVGMISPYVFQGIIIATTTTMITTAYTDRYSEKIYAWLSKNLPFDAPEKIQRSRTQISTPLKDHIILVGYDVQGRKIGEYLRERDEDFVVIEINPEKLEMAEELENYIFKSGTERETWEMANHKEAKMIISTAPQRNISERILTLETEAKKVVRSNKFREASELLGEGADYVMVPDLLASEELIDCVQEVLYGGEGKLEEIRENLLKNLKKDLETLREEES